MANYTLSEDEQEYFVYVPSTESGEFFQYLRAKLEAFDVNVGVRSDANNNAEDSFRFEKMENPEQKAELEQLLAGFQSPVTT